VFHWEIHKNKNPNENLSILCHLRILISYPGVNCTATGLHSYVISLVKYTDFNIVSSSLWKQCIGDCSRMKPELMCVLCVSHIQLNHIKFLQLVPNDRFHVVFWLPQLDIIFTSWARIFTYHLLWCVPSIFTHHIDIWHANYIVKTIY